MNYPSVNAGTAGAILDAVQHLPRHLLWRLRAERPVSVGGVEARYYTGSLPEAAFVDKTYRTEKDVLASAVDAVEPDDIVWDVGANCGLYTCLLGQKVTEGEIVAFEPLDRNVERLEQDLALSGVDATIRQVALGDAERTVTFDPPTFADTFRGTTSIAPEANGQAVEVQMQRGEDLVERGEVRAPSVVKIDVEGAEGLVLEGMSGLLGDPRAVFCELHPESMAEYGTSEGEVLDLLADQGYECEILRAGDDTRHVEAVRRS